MKSLKLISCLALALWLSSARAQYMPTVVFSNAWFTGAPNNRQIHISLRSQFGQTGGQTVLGFPMTLQPTNGVASTNLIGGLSYIVTFDGVNKAFVMPTIPNTNLVFNAIDLINNGAALDAPFPALAAGTNISLVTNWIAGFPVCTIASSNGQLTAAILTDTNWVTQDASGITVVTNQFVTSQNGSATNLTALGGTLLVTNPAGNVATLTIQGNSGTGGIAVNMSSTPAGLTVGQSVTAPQFIGPLTGNASGSASSFTGNLSGDVIGTQSSTSVGKVGGTNIQTFIDAVGDGRYTQQANNGSDFSTPRNVGANIGTKQLSPLGGNNAISDMQAGTANFEGQLAISYFGDKFPAFWFASTGGATGTNTFGANASFPGGLETIGSGGFGFGGNWIDLPLSRALDNLSIYWGYGPAASSHFYATNGGGLKQPALSLFCANPWSGACGLQMSAAFTNASHGVLVGTNADGIPIYNPQFGNQFLQIGDAYRPDSIHGYPPEAQSIGNWWLMNDTTLMGFIGWNGAKNGDTNGLGQPIGSSQVPQIIFDPTGMPNDAIVHVPLFVPNAWVPTNANYKDAFLVHQGTGICETWSNLCIGSQAIGDDGGHMLDVNGSANFNQPGSGNNGAWTFDGVSSHSLGFWAKWGQVTKLAHGNGRSFFITQNTSGSDILANLTGTQFDELMIGPDGSVNVLANNLVVSNAHNLIVSSGYVGMKTAGNGLRITEGSNAKSGTFQLNGTSAVTVNTTAVVSTNISRILLTIQTAGGTVGSPYVSSVTSGTSFTAKSTASGDTSTCAYFIYDNNP